MMKKIAMALSAATLAFGFATSSHAQPIDPQQAYQEAMAQCEMLSGDAKTNCRRDAGAALQQAKRNPKQHVDEQTLARHRTARCQALPEHLREDCLAQMTGQHETQVYGSVEGGGILRQTTITIPGEPYQPAQPAVIESSPTPSPVQ
ncbi:MAG: hypothetical protein GX332_05045 [Alcaligenaceae bacterium]|nr:hypothetical protein [Alcaligenaceae bacterium]